MARDVKGTEAQVDAQLAKVSTSAHDLGCDESEEKFDAALKKTDAPVKTRVDDNYFADTADVPNLIAESKSAPLDPDAGLPPRSKQSKRGVRRDSRRSSRRSSRR